jgi:hypothetical protein
LQTAITSAARSAVDGNELAARRVVTPSSLVTLCSGVIDNDDRELQPSCTHNFAEPVSKSASVSVPTAAAAVHLPVAPEWARGHWEILRLREWHGYGPALLAGLRLVATELVLVVQHDYAFLRAAPVAQIAAAMLAASAQPSAATSVVTVADAADELGSRSGLLGDNGSIGGDVSTDGGGGCGGGTAHASRNDNCGNCGPPVESYQTTSSPSNRVPLPKSKLPVNFVGLLKKAQVHYRNALRSRRGLDIGDPIPLSVLLPSPLPPPPPPPPPPPIITAIQSPAKSPTLPAHPKVPELKLMLTRSVANFQFQCPVCDVLRLTSSARV